MKLILDFQEIHLTLLNSQRSEDPSSYKKDKGTARSSKESESRI